MAWCSQQAKKIPSLRVQYMAEFDPKAGASEIGNLGGTKGKY